MGEPTIASVSRRASRGTTARSSCRAYERLRPGGRCAPARVAPAVRGTALRVVLASRGHVRRDGEGRQRAGDAPRSDALRTVGGPVTRALDRMAPISRRAACRSSGSGGHEPVPVGAPGADFAVPGASPPAVLHVHHVWPAATATWCRSRTSRASWRDRDGAPGRLLALERTQRWLKRRELARADQVVGVSRAVTAALERDYDFDAAPRARDRERRGRARPVARDLPGARGASTPARASGRARRRRSCGCSSAGSSAEGNRSSARGVRAPRRRAGHARQLWIVGDGSQRDARRGPGGATRRPERVHFEGAVDDSAPFFGLPTRFALASRWEGLPLALLEAQAAGLPVVAAAAGGVAEAVRDGMSGASRAARGRRGVRGGDGACQPSPGSARGRRTRRTSGSRGVELGAHGERRTRCFTSGSGRAPGGAREGARLDGTQEGRDDMNRRILPITPISRSASVWPSFRHDEHLSRTLEIAGRGAARSGITPSRIVARGRGRLVAAERLAARSTAGRRAASCGIATHARGGTRGCAAGGRAASDTARRRRHGDEPGWLGAAIRASRCGSNDSPGSAASSTRRTGAAGRSSAGADVVRRGRGGHRQTAARRRFWRASARSRAGGFDVWLPSEDDAELGRRLRLGGIDDEVLRKVAAFDTARPRSFGEDASLVERTGEAAGLGSALRRTRARSGFSRMLGPFARRAAFLWVVLGPGFVALSAAVRSPSGSGPRSVISFSRACAGRPAPLVLGVLALLTGRSSRASSRAVRIRSVSVPPAADRAAAQGRAVCVAGGGRSRIRHQDERMPADEACAIQTSRRRWWEGPEPRAGPESEIGR